MAILVIPILVALLALVFSIYLLVPMILGAPFVRTRKAAIATMLDLLELKPGDLVVDLGSGDGEILIQAAKSGARGLGYEINPMLVWRSQVRVKKLGLSDKVTIIKQSFWSADLSQAGAIVLFGITHIMPRLEKKLQAELKPGTRVASFTFKFPNWQPVKEQNNVRLYKK